MTHKRVSETRSKPPDRAQDWPLLATRSRASLAVQHHGLVTGRRRRGAAPRACVFHFLYLNFALASCRAGAIGGRHGHVDAAAACRRFHGDRSRGVGPDEGFLGAKVHGRQEREPGAGDRHRYPARALFGDKPVTVGGDPLDGGTSKSVSVGTVLQAHRCRADQIRCRPSRARGRWTAARTCLSPAWRR